jgi:ribonuclease HII
MTEIRYLIGIDEAGRGPLAGPVSVGAVLVPVDFDWTLVEGARDSKQMSERNREAMFERMHESPVQLGLVASKEQYPWSSLSFQRQVSPYKTEISVPG